LSARVLPIYLRAWLTSLPLGGTNGFAVHTLPDAVWIAEREPQPVSFANAYSAPVRTNSITEIIDQFATYAERVHRFYNATPTQAWTLCPHPDTKLDTLGKRVTLDQLLADTADLALPVRT
jgi:CRISPR system Cascade subunit CasC